MTRTTNPSECSFTGCPRPEVARRLCQSHYLQHRRGEELRPIRRWKTGSDQEVFDIYVVPAEGCWVWQGSLDAHGYGIMKSRKAHRVSYELHKGPIPFRTHVLHTCDNPPCVNPDHLWLGTDADNVADMMRKGRGRNQYS